MALIFSDGFSLYQDLTGATLLKGWSGSSGGSGDMTFRSTGRWGTASYGVYIADTGNNDARLARTVSTSGSTTIVGVAINTTVHTTTNNAPFLIISNGTATVSLNWVTGVKIAITNGGGTTYFTIPSGLAASTWYYLEIKIVWSATTGQIIFRMDTSQYYDSGATLSLGSSANANSLTLGTAAVGTWAIRTVYTDLLLMDGTGSNFNDFQNDVRIETLLPDGDGQHTGWSIGGNTLLTSVNQARFTVDTSGWATLTGSPAFTRSATGGPKTTIPSYANLTGASGTVSIINTPNGTSGYPVTAGQTVRVGGYSGINTGSSISVSLRFYDAVGVQVGSDVGTSNLSNAAGGAWIWNSGGSGVTVPAGAATCAIILSPNGGGKFTGIVLAIGSSPAGYVDPSGAHHFETSDAVHDSDITYVKTNTVGTKDTYTMDDLQATTGNVLGVTTFAVARKENASINTVNTLVRVGGNDYSGGVVNLPDNLTYQSMNTFYPVNPATGTAWTRPEVNGMEAGVELPS